MTRVLYIGGSGEISFACVEASVRAGQQVTVFNRGIRGEKLPGEVEQVIGDVNDDAAYAELASREFDTVCQFIAFHTDTVSRDIDTFAGRCGQYVFVSSASAYRKPWRSGSITESTPLDNPFWEYSRLKAACEKLLFEAHVAGRLPVTIVRPSHTYRRRIPGTCVPGIHLAWRILNDKPVIVHDDGESMWTLTHAEDFARAFAGLCGNEHVLGEAFHITSDSARSWNEIVDLVGKALAHPPRIVHVPTDRLIEYSGHWLGPIKGDKSNSLVFDNSKVRGATGGWRCEIGLQAGLGFAATIARKQIDDGYAPDERLDALIDRIVADCE
ncbi:MAG: SDR family oxidoreductase [Gammaproteobacteria bacterium]|nr:SDR family oxidoreductase [Gammaproteobacteria bacterium]MYH84711.1 SDR family oxidoreductase [Gammaproteobacteria bacterium]MYK06105.1 SDR family oxidoreductase [Gammaproteobacteria bacterium]